MAENKNTKYTEQELLNAIVEVTLKLKKKVTDRDMLKIKGISPNPFKKRFGSFVNARDEAYKDNKEVQEVLDPKALLEKVKTDLLVPNNRYDSKELTKIFIKVQQQGGMRKSNLTNSLLLITHRSTDVKEAIYEDRWDGDTLYYTGMGQIGDQSLEFAQNKTLNEAKKNATKVYLFEVFNKGEYTFRGEVELIEEPFREEQRDGNGNLRNVWIFPVKVIDNFSITDIKDIIEREEKLSKKARKLSIIDLQKKAKGKIKPSIRRSIVNNYERDQIVVEYAKRRAGGHCDLCGCDAPFKNKNGEAYLEVHHIMWLSEGGSDTIGNVAALCPNCHRKMHSLNLEEDKKMLLEKAKETL